MKVSENQLIFSIFTMAVLSACSGAVTAVSPNSSTITTPVVPVEGGTEPAARMVFHRDNFTDLVDFATAPIASNFKCLGDITRTFRADAGDFISGPQAFPSVLYSDALNPTTKPNFIKNVAVDVTQTYFLLTESSVVQTDTCSYRDIASTPEPSSCADFDDALPAAPLPTSTPTPTPAVTPVPTVLPITTEYYGTHYYRVRDDWCTNQGPIRNADEETSKAYVGGVSIDLDRTQLGEHEDLLMLVTYHSLNTNASWPGPQLSNDRTILKVNLIATLQSLDTLMGVQQPRAWNYYQSAQTPVIVKEIATLEDPFGSLRTEQVYIPLSQNALIDRIRIDRIRGSYHLYQIDLYRLGNRSN